MDVYHKKSKSVKLWALFGLFIGLIVGLIVYEVRQYVLAIEQLQNYEAVRKMQSEDLKEVYKETIELEKAQKEAKKNTVIESDSL